MSTYEINQQIAAALEDWKKGTRLVSLVKLQGGISAEPYLLDIETPEGVRE